MKGKKSIDKHAEGPHFAPALCECEIIRTVRIRIKNRGTMVIYFIHIQ